MARKLWVSRDKDDPGNDTAYVHVWRGKQPTLNNDGMWMTPELECEEMCYKSFLNLTGITVRTGTCRAIEVKIWKKSK